VRLTILHITVKQALPATMEVPVRRLAKAAVEVRPRLVS
jgi:hypothetical protein